MIQQIINYVKGWSRGTEIIPKYYYNDGHEIITIGHQMVLEVEQKYQSNMETSVAVMPKIYYFENEAKKEIVPYVSKKGNIGVNFVNNKRIVIAASFSNGILKVGYSICSPEDNFVRAKGNQLAKQRMEEGLISFPFAGVNPSEKNLIAGVVEGIMNSIEADPGRFERRLHAHNIKMQTIKMASNVAVDVK